MASSPSTRTIATHLDQLRKHVEWQSFMVDATIALTCTGSPLPGSLEEWKREPEGAKLAILNILNALEVKNLYTWPNFLALGLNFDYIMKLRRALVTDLTAALLKSKEFQDALKKRRASQSSIQPPTPQTDRETPIRTKQSHQTQAPPPISRARSEIPESDSGSNSGNETNCLRCETNPREWVTSETKRGAWSHLLQLFDIEEPLEWVDQDVSSRSSAEHTFKAIKEKCMVQYKTTKEWKALRKTVESHEYLLELFELEELGDGVPNALDAKALAESICEAITEKVLAKHKQPTSQSSLPATDSDPETQMVDGDADDEASLMPTRTPLLLYGHLKRRLESPPPSSQLGARRRI